MYVADAQREVRTAFLGLALVARERRAEAAPGG